MPQTFTTKENQHRKGKTDGCADARESSLFKRTGNMKKMIKQMRRCIVYTHSTLVSLVFHPVPAMLILVGGLSFMWYYPRLIIKLLRCTLNQLLIWLGIDADWCALAEAGLGVEAANSPLHLVNTFAMRINAHYFSGVKWPKSEVVLLPSRLHNR